MPIIPMAPPVPVAMPGGFDYITVDGAHRRMYGAHPGADSLLIVNADTGAVTHQIKVGPMAGVAYNAAGTRVYTGNGDGKSVSESDPATFEVLRTVTVDGPVDAIAYDESNGHIYADEDNGTRIFVIDANTMKQIGTVALPGHKPEYLVVDPQTHVLYQNIADMSEIAVVDPKTLTVKSTIKTPEIVSNHPLQYDAQYEHLLVGGKNGVLSIYGTDGTKKFQAVMPGAVDQCDLDQTTHQLACAGAKGISVFQTSADAAPTLIGTYAAPDPSLRTHNVGFDPKTHEIFATWADEAHGKDYVQRFKVMA